jgi:hypothetical protein
MVIHPVYRKGNIDGGDTSSSRFVHSFIEFVDREENFISHKGR